MLLLYQVHFVLVAVQLRMSLPVALALRCQLQCVHSCGRTHNASAGDIDVRTHRRLQLATAVPIGLLLSVRTYCT